MARQKLIATADIVLPEGMDVFAGAEHAKSAKTVLEQAEKEIRKVFPDFKFAFTIGNYRDPGSPAPGRRSAADIAAAKAAEEKAAAEKLAAENAAAAAGNGKAAGASAG